MTNTLIKIFVVSASAYVFVFLLIQWFEYMTLYHPSVLTGEPLNPFMPFEDHMAPTEDGQSVNVWYFKNPSAQWTALLCHGNAGNNSHRMDQISALYRRSLSVAIFDYRGYGKSTGHPSENGLYLDGEAVVRFMNERLSIPPERIVIIGTSLGGAVAAELASRRRFRALILESAFTSKHDMARTIMPFFPFALFGRNQFVTIEKIKCARSPVMIAHGTNDEMVPYAMSRNLLEAAPEPKFHYPIKGAMHNNYLSVGGADYLNTLSRFIDSLKIN